MFFTLKLSGLKLLRWFVFRFLYVRIILNWAWDPDWFDFQKGTVNIGLFRPAFLCPRLVGGLRLIFPIERLDETMLWKLPAFREMIKYPDEVEILLQENMELIAEATRFLLSVVVLKSERERRARAKQTLMGGLYAACRDNQRPIVFMVVNRPLMVSLQQNGFEMIVLGKHNFPAKNSWEKKSGRTVTHFVVVINLLATESALPVYVAEKFGYVEERSLNRRLSQEQIEKVEELWQQLKGLS